MTAITLLRVEALRPNDYNPNEMTEAEFTELVAEVRHLAHVPKPIIVRPNGGDYLIVDGEHGWRAAKEAGLETVPCEVVDVDDFEAKRQTYKRNQHGTHNPVRLGQMFKTMMLERKLSQRELAKEMEISDGTVRNALEYAKAAEVRNDYAWQGLGVRQVRWYNRLPRVIGDPWLKVGADCALLGFERGDPAHLDDPECPGSSKFLIENGIKRFQHLADSGLFEHVSFGYGPEGFASALKAAAKYERWEDRYCRGGLTREAVRPYTKHFLGKGTLNVWFPDAKHEWDSLSDSVLDAIFDGTTKPPSFILSSVEFDQAVSEAAELRENADSFVTRLGMLVSLKTGAPPKTNKHSLELQLLERELKDAPDWIRDARVDIRGRYDVWKAEVDDDLKRSALSGGMGGHRSTGGELWLPSDIADRMYETSKLRRNATELLQTPTETLTNTIAEAIAERLKYRDLTRSAEETSSCSERLRSLNKIDLILIRDAFENTNRAEVFRILGRTMGKFGEGAWSDPVPPEENVILKCGECGTSNRIPADRLNDSPKCGKCNALIAERAVEAPA